MTQLVIGYLNTPKNPNKMGDYKNVAAEALTKHGGEVVVPTVKPERLEGDGETDTPILVLSFPTADHARAWRDDPELVDIHELRRAGADMTFLLVEHSA